MEKLQSSADYTVDESYTIDTRDHEDHTFNGIMFDLVVKELLPVEYVEVSQIWVRGMLGNLTVWMTEGPHERVFDQSEKWTKLFEGSLQPSISLVPLEFDYPLSLPGGMRIGLYVHSTRPDDRAIVYDNQRNSISHEDSFIQITSGCAHLVPRPFDSIGRWGWGWRPKREFVGRVSYGVKYFLWKPESKVHLKFPNSFEHAATTVLCCSKRMESPLSVLPDEIIFYILNMCSWDWFGSDSSTPEEKSGFGSNFADRYMQRERNGHGIGWHSYNYRSMITEHMCSSQSGRELYRQLRGEDDVDGNGENVLVAEETLRYLHTNRLYCVCAGAVASMLLLLWGVMV
jgi:hypothetical protein